MKPYAQASCILSMNMNCEACKMNVIEVLSSIIGVYSIDIDANQGRIKIFGEVDPNILLNAIARTGRHAKVIWARLNHPSVNRNSTTYQGGGDYDYCYGNGYGSISGTAALDKDCYGYGYGYGRGALPPSSYSSGYGDAHHYCPMRRLVPDYYPSSSSSYYSDHRVPAAMHIPSYPSPVYDPYQDDSVSLCNIM